MKRPKKHYTNSKLTLPIFHQKVLPDLEIPRIHNSIVSMNSEQLLNKTREERLQRLGNNLPESPSSVIITGQAVLSNLALWNSSQLYLLPQMDKQNIEKFTDTITRLGSSTDLESLVIHGALSALTLDSIVELAMEMTHNPWARTLHVNGENILETWLQRREALLCERIRQNPSRGSLEMFDWDVFDWTALPSVGKKNGKEFMERLQKVPRTKSLDWMLVEGGLSLSLFEKMEKAMKMKRGEWIGKVTLNGKNVMEHWCEYKHALMNSRSKLKRKDMSPERLAEIRRKDAERKRRDREAWTEEEREANNRKTKERMRKIRQREKMQRLSQKEQNAEETQVKDEEKEKRMKELSQQMKLIQDQIAILREDTNRDEMEVASTLMSISSSHAKASKKKNTIAMIAGVDSHQRR